MDALDAGIMGGVIAIVLALIEVVKKLINGRLNGNGKLAKALTEAERKAIFDTDRAVAELSRLHARQTEILMSVDKTLAIMAERQCPYGRNNT